MAAAADRNTKGKIMTKSTRPLSRRKFIRSASALAAGLAALGVEYPSCLRRRRSCRSVAVLKNRVTRRDSATPSRMRRDATEMRPATG